MLIVVETMPSVHRENLLHIFKAYLVSLGVNSVTTKMFGDDLNQCLHVFCHGLVAIYLHLTEALDPFVFITLAFEIYWTSYDGKDVY